MSLAITNTVDPPNANKQCFSCEIGFNNVADKRNHDNFTHELEKTMSKCPVCGKLFFKFLTCKEHAQHTHQIKLSGKLSSRIALESPVTTEVWMSLVHAHSEKFGKRRTKWMRFLVNRLLQHRERDGQIFIKVRWAEPYNSKRYDTFESIEHLLEDCPDLVVDYCFQQNLELPPKSEKTEKLEKKEPKTGQKLEKREKIRPKIEKKVEKTEIIDLTLKLKSSKI